MLHALLRRLPPAVLATGLVLVLAAHPASAQDYEKFVQDFHQAMSVNDGPRMASLVKARSLEATWHVDKICTAIGERSSEELEKEAQALMVAWRAGRETAFADNYYAYLSLMRPEDRRERNRFKGAFDRTQKTFQENAAGERSGPVYGQVATELEGLAASFQAIGDHYNVAQCWATYAACFNEGFRDPKEVDSSAVLRGYENALKAFERVDLKNSVYGDIKQHYERLTAEGYTAETPAGEGGAGAEEDEPAEPTAAAIPVAMAFEPLEEIDAYERPNYMADEIYQMWQWLTFMEKGSSAHFHSLQDGGPTLYRVGPAELGVDADGDGTPEQPIPMTGNLEVVQCQLTAGGPQRGWAFAIKTGIEEDTYQRLAYHMAPQDAWVNVYFVAAGSMVGTLAGTELRVIDENMDGIYGGPAWSWEYLGLTKDHYHWEMDSLVIGGSKRALPWSEICQVGDAWYRLATVDAGTRLEATPIEPKTGKLKLAFKGPPVSWMVLQGTGKLSTCYYDVASERGGVEVPVGTYVLLEGEVRKGKKAQTMKALVLPGASTPSWTVEAGKTTEVELGGPFGFDFRTERSEEGVTVLGKSVVITGQHGERYERPWNCVPRPEIEVRKQGTKKGNKPQEMDAVLDMLEMDGAGGFRFGQQDAWFPLDTTVPFVGDAYEVQLSEKKNPLFGKLESDWK